MATTIQVSEKLKKRLLKHKTHPRQPYEEVIAQALDVLEAEDTLHVAAATKKRIAAGRRNAAKGELLTMDEVRRKLGL